MDQNFEVNPALAHLVETRRQGRSEADLHLRDEAGAAEVLATNADVPFSLRLGAQERKLLMALARSSGKSMSQLARELLVEGLFRLEAAQRSDKPEVERTEISSLLDNLRKLTMLAQAAEATVERVSRRQA